MLVYLTVQRTDEFSSARIFVRARCFVNYVMTMNGSYWCRLYVPVLIDCLEVSSNYVCGQKTPIG